MLGGVASALGMTIETPRLILRPWTLDDAPAAFRMYGDPEVTRYLGLGGVEESVESQRVRLETVIPYYETLAPQGYGFWAAEERQTGEVVGAGLLKPLKLSEGEQPNGDDPEVEVGWHLAKACWGMGYGTEIGRALVEHGFQGIGLERIYAVAYPENVASVHIMEKLNMTCLGMTSRYYGVSVVAYRIERPAAGTLSGSISL